VAFFRSHRRSIILALVSLPLSLLMTILAAAFLALWNGSGEEPRWFVMAPAYVVYWPTFLIATISSKPVIEFISVYTLVANALGWGVALFSISELLAYRKKNT